MPTRYTLLGDVRILADDRVVAVTQPRVRDLLVALLADVNTALSVDTLVHRVWGDDLPRNPRASLQTQMHRLRALMGGDELVRLPGGYAIQADPESVDLHRFRRLVAEGRERGSAVPLTEALGLWTGEVLGSAETPWAIGLRAALDEERRAAQRSLAVPRQLPAAPLSFVGRNDELRRLDPIASGATIAAIAGTGGVGKTWLALRWAHDNAAGFPCGQLYANLRGFDPAGAPVAPAAVLRSFLHALGVPPQDIPRDEEARSALYRDLVADRKLLVVLDNARDAAQVAPLLPGGAGSVLITSRHDLAGLTADRVFVDYLDDDGSRRLLAHHVGAHRLEAEPADTAALLRYCAGLPLALSIVATRAAQYPAFPLAALSAELTDGLDALDDPSANLSAVLAGSYHALTPAAARSFRLLGLVIGPDLSLAAATALTGDADPLAELERVHLVEEHRPGRYRMHDLVARYAREIAEPDDAATARLLDHYLSTDQLEAEFDNIVAAGDFAAAHGWHDHAWRLANVLWYYRYTRGHSSDWVPSLERALAAARRTGDVLAEAATVKNLGVALFWNSRFDEAIRCFEQALEVYAAVDDQPLMAATLNNLGAACARLGQDAESLAYYERAVACADLQPEFVAWALGNMSVVLAGQGRVAEAEAHCLRALELIREARSDDIEGHVFGNLAIVLRASGRLDEALDNHRHALDLLRAAGDRAGECETLNEIGETLAVMGDPAAVEAFRQALALAEVMANPHEIARARRQLEC
ncbi:tetratricopeptide repeat protein [Lentzea sp. NPDC051213]|uniref:tetratricopeptide repeat protein n=1 Tax=Lentzea sp. NPDC051213 TaxID=3364126 RepID=UPI0037A1E94F